MEKALKFAEEYIDIPTDDKTIIKHARKSLPFNKSETWMKKDSGLFDVAMGAFEGAEVCELVGNFLLHKLSEKYSEAITKAGYKHEMRYQQNIRQNTTTTKNRKRNITWFNLPYNANVVTKIGKHFLSLLDKHFPLHNKFHKIFNRNTVKISYSCMPNMKTNINSHNHKITNSKTITKERTCNYVDKAKCLLSQNCLINNIIYKAVLTSTNLCYKEKIYFGTAETTFKLRYSNHQRSFKILKYKRDTELPNEVWRIKKSRQKPVISWEIVR